MKIDRLLAITMYLLNSGTVSASALAERFEVSKRTIQRDIDALNQAGIPIISTYGKEGGYEIMDGVLRLDLCSEYEHTGFIRELLILCTTDFFLLFGTDQIITKAVPIASDRLQILSELNFRPCELPGRAHSWCLERAE